MEQKIVKQVQDLMEKQGDKYNEMHVKTNETVRKMIKVFEVQLKKQYETEKSIESLQCELKNLRQENSELTELLKQCNRKCDQASSFEKKHNIIISGMEECKSETTEKLLAQVNHLVCKDLQTDVTVDTVWRMGKPDYTKTRKIMATFRTISDREKVLNKKTALKKRQGKPVYINPDLPVETCLRKFQERETRRKELNLTQQQQSSHTDSNWRKSLTTEKEHFPIFKAAEHKITASEHLAIRKTAPKLSTINKK